MWCYESLSSQNVKMSPCEVIVSMCSIRATYCTCDKYYCKGRVKNLFSIAPPFWRNIGWKVAHYCHCNCNVYCKALTPQFSCVCAGTVYVMTAAGNGWGGVTFLTPSARIKIRIIYTTCVKLHCLVFGSRF